MNHGLHSRAEIAEWLEQIDGVLAAAITLDFSGAAQQVWVALANGTSPAAIRETVSDRLAALGIHCPAHAVRIGVVPEPPAADEPDTDPLARAYLSEPGPAASSLESGAGPVAPTRSSRRRRRHERPGAGPLEPLGSQPAPRRRRRERAESDVADSGHAGRPAGRFLLLEDVETRSSNNRLRIRVTLELAGRPYRGVAVDVDTETGRARAAARATLDAAMSAVPGPRLALDALQIQPLFGRRFVALSVEAAEARRVAQLSAMTEVDGSIEHAAATAALRAVERWITA